MLLETLGGINNLKDKSMLLLPTQRNALLDCIVELGISPINLSYSENEEERMVSIEVHNSPFFFRFVLLIGNDDLQIVKIHMSPSKQSLSKTMDTNLRWDEFLKRFQNWAVLLKREIDAPDKWGNINKYRNVFRLEDFNNENIKFTDDEIANINKSILMLKEKLSEFENNTEKLKLIEYKLDYIYEKSKSLGKIDWKNIFIGAIMSLSLQLGYNEELAKRFFLIVKEHFNHLLELLLN